MPISVIMIGLSSAPTNRSNILSIKFIKLLKLFTLYKLLTLARVIRLFKNNKMMEYFISKINISSDIRIGIVSISRIIFMIHLIGSAWIIIGELNEVEVRDNWLRSNELEDASKLMQYVTSCYWAVVTIATVGYGDITPQNTEEAEANILIILIGVTFYSYIVSRVTTIFNASQEVE